MLDQREAMNVAGRYAEAVTKEFSPAAVVLFGSYAKGSPNENSDIDIGVVFDGFSGDWMKTSTKLWDLAYDISFDIEPHMLDIKEDKSGFARFVCKTGQIIYQADAMRRPGRSGLPRA